MAAIVVSENMEGPAMRQLAQRFDVLHDAALWREPDRLKAALAGAQALIVRNQTQVNAALLQDAGALKIVARAGVGLDNIDVDAATEKGVVVCYTPSQNTLSVAELTLGLMLALARKISAADRHVRSGKWARRQFMGVELAGNTLGVVGFGRIGVAVARIASAMGMEILAYDPFVADDAPILQELHAQLLDLDTLLQRSDFVTCHLPGNEQTRGLFNAEKFAAMRPGAFFINVARGEVVNEQDLLACLANEGIAGAALDVRQTEPPSEEPFAAFENVVLTPHIGAFTEQGQRRVLEAVCRDVAAVLSGQAAQDFVNFPQPPA